MKDDIQFIKPGDPVPKGDNVYIRRSEYTEDEQREQIAKSEQHIKQLERALSQTVKDMKPALDNIRHFYVENKDVLDRVDEWEEISGLTMDEIDGMDFSEAIELIRNKMGNLNPDFFEVLDSSKPPNYIVPNNRLMKLLAANKIPFNLKDVPIALSAKLKETHTNLVMINFDDNNIRISNGDKPFDRKDREIFNAFCSLYDAGNRKVTSRQVYRTMNALLGSEDVTPGTLEDIENRIEKQMMMFVDINFEVEYRHYNKLPKNKKIDTAVILKDQLLPVAKITLDSGNGIKTNGFVIKDQPVLYKYAQEFKQVVSIPLEILNIKKLNSTSRNNLIKIYIATRIEQLNSKKKRGLKLMVADKRILFESIYEHAEIVNVSATERGRIRKTIEVILKDFASKKYIKSYEFKKDGRSYTKVDFDTYS